MLGLCQNISFYSGGSDYTNTNKIIIINYQSASDESEKRFLRCDNWYNVIDGWNFGKWTNWPEVSQVPNINSKPIARAIFIKYPVNNFAKIIFGVL